MKILLDNGVPRLKMVLGNQQWPNVRNQITRIVQAVESAAPGTLMEVDIPFAS